MQEQKLKTPVALALAALAVASRLADHPYGFTALGGVTLYAGSRRVNAVLGLLLPFLALWISDLILNNIIYSEYATGFIWFTRGFEWLWIGYLAVWLLSKIMHPERGWGRLIGGAVGAAVIFYLISNFSVWLDMSAGKSDDMYHRTFDGLVLCYVRGLPFLRNAVLGDVFYSVLLFKGLDWATRRYPSLLLARA